MGNITEVLKDLGFEEREIKIYLALIRFGDLTALKVSKDTGIDRTTTYDLLERLISKGIVSSYLKNKSKNFSALPPKKLLMHFKEKYSSLETILPKLNNLANQPQGIVKCELFQGKEGLRSVIKDLVNETKEYRVIGIQKGYEEILGYFSKQAFLKSNQSKIKEIAIVEKNAQFDKLKNGEYRYLNKNLLSPVTTLMYRNKVVFFIWKQPYFAVSIESELLAKSQTEYFNLLWGIAKK